jgi:uncharacterized phage-associated protein
MGKVIYLNNNKGGRRMISVIGLANTIIQLGNQEKIDITPMKLQKLLYFIYKRYLKYSGNPLFSNRFEAWKYGPVVRCVYDEFKQFGANPITKYAKNSEGKAPAVKMNKNAKFIREVWDKYKYYDGIELSTITHQKGTAWDKAVKNGTYILEDKDIKNEPDSE